MNFLYFAISLARVNCLVPIKMFYCLAFGTTGVGRSEYVVRASPAIQPVLWFKCPRDRAEPTLVLGGESECC